jgi:hypothetical protein
MKIGGAEIANALKLVLLTSGLMAYYAGTGSYSALFGCSSLLLICFVRRFSVSDTSILTLILAAIFFTIKFFISGKEYLDLAYDLRFFWGFLAFFMFFSSENTSGERSGPNKYDDYFRVVAHACILLLLVEFISSNAMGIHWPNRSHEFYWDSLAGIARAYGFGGNASVTVVLLVALSAMLFSGYLRDIAVFLMSLNTTGFIVIYVKAMLQSKVGGKIIFSLVALATICSGVFLADYYKYPFLEKLSTSYMSYVYEFKKSQVLTTINSLGIRDFLFGQSLRDVGLGLRTGDFQALDFFLFNGFFGVALFVLIVGANVNKRNVIPVILLLLGSFHYQVIFSFPGQIIFGWILARSRSGEPPAPAPSHKDQIRPGSET